MTSRTVQLSVSFACAGNRVNARTSRDVQRGLARQALACVLDALPRERDEWQATSLSHSRGVALASAMTLHEDQPPPVMGCDVECADAPRLWREIGAVLTGAPFTDEPALAARAWTLAEAWFKAFQVWPVPSLVRRALEGDRLAVAGDVVTLASSVQWFAFEPVPGFQASVVWRGPRVTPAVIAAASGGDATSGSAP